MLADGDVASDQVGIAQYPLFRAKIAKVGSIIDLDRPIRSRVSLERAIDGFELSKAGDKNTAILDLPPLMKIHRRNEPKIGATGDDPS